MGKPTGFLDYEREDAKASSPKDFIRLTTFLNLLQEFVLHFVKKHVHVVFMEMQ